MKFPLKSSLALAALVVASPSSADIVSAAPSASQGFNVHNDGSAVTGTTVTGQLGDTGTGVLFTGTTTDSNNLMLSPGQGTAKITGALDLTTKHPTDSYDITAFNIALAGNNPFDWIELSLTGHGTVSFSLLDTLGNVFTSDGSGLFTYVLGRGENQFAFQGINGQSIASLSFSIAGGDVENVKQVRITPAAAAAAVPEPATWAMMLVGFGIAGYSMRRRRRPALMQMA
jgi:PEP-CTERM motif